MGILNDVLNTVSDLWNGSGIVQLFTGFGWQNAIMIAVSCLLIYLAIHKQYEPLLLLPIAFGMLLANLPLAGLNDVPEYV